jgi:hypothetical protein
MNSALRDYYHSIRENEAIHTDLATLNIPITLRLQLLNTPVTCR